MRVGAQNGVNTYSAQAVLEEAGPWRATQMTTLLAPRKMRCLDRGAGCAWGGREEGGREDGGCSFMRLSSAGGRQNAPASTSH